MKMKIVEVSPDENKELLEILEDICNGKFDEDDPNEKNEKVADKELLVKDDEVSKAIAIAKFIQEEYVNLMVKVVAMMMTEDRDLINRIFKDIANKSDFNYCIQVLGI